MKTVSNIWFMAVGIMLGCSMMLVSCDTDPEIIELPTEITMTTSVSIDFSDEKSEYEAEIPVGAKIPIKVTNGKTYQWASLNSNVARVENDSIDALSVGKTDIVDLRGGKATIHVNVIENN